MPSSEITFLVRFTIVGQTVCHRCAIVMATSSRLGSCAQSRFLVLLSVLSVAVYCSIMYIRSTASDRQGSLRFVAYSLTVLDPTFLGR
jgi:hypothetical protein